MKTYNTTDGPFDDTLVDALLAAMPERPSPTDQHEARARLLDAAESVLGEPVDGGDRRVDRALQLLRKQGKAEFRRMSRVWCRK